MRLAGLCKGSTADSDSVCEGSNPSPAAIEKQFAPSGGLLLFCSQIRAGFGPSHYFNRVRSAEGAEGSNPSPAAIESSSPLRAGCFYFAVRFGRDSDPHIISIASLCAEGAEGSNPSPAAIERNLFCLPRQKRFSRWVEKNIFW